MILFMNDKGICRISPVTMGLLNIFKHVPVIAVTLKEEEKVIQIHNHAIEMY